MERVDIEEQHGKSRHSAALWKKETHRSSVEKVDIAQHCEKSRHIAGA